MAEMIFPVSIGGGGYIEISLDLSFDDKEILMKYKQKYDDGDDDAEEFEDIEELHDLYEELCNEAYDEMANSLADDEYFVREYCKGNYDFETAREYVTENFWISIDYPEVEE